METPPGMEIPSGSPPSSALQPPTILLGLARTRLASAVGVCLLMGLGCQPLSSVSEGDAVMGSSFAFDLAPMSTAEQALVVCAAGETLFGIDVSKWQGTIDWNAVAGAAVEYAFIRVSDGLNFPDERFAENWAGALSSGVRRGAYQFFRPGQDALAQANYFLDTMGPLLPGDLPPVIDVEAADGLGALAVAAAVRVWIDRVEGELGVAPIIYTGRYFWAENVNDASFNVYPLWHPGYPLQGSPGNDDWIGRCPNINDQWSDWALWQYASTGAIAGIAGGVDVNRFNGDAAALEAFAGSEPVCDDGFCSAGEVESCPADCPVCEVVPADGRVIDDDDECFTAGGAQQYIRVETGVGYSGGLKWTMSWVNDTPENFGLWELNLDEAGEYLLEVYTDASFAEHVAAPYTVTHDGSITSVAVDQTLNDGWTVVGIFDFAAGGGQSLRLDDIVDDESTSGLQVVLDALRLTRTDGNIPAVDAGPGPEPDAEPDTDAGLDSDSGSGSDAGPDVGNEPDPAPTVDAGTQQDLDPGNGLADGGDELAFPGCVCVRAPAAPGAGLAIFWLFGAAFVLTARGSRAQPER